MGACNRVYMEVDYRGLPEMDRDIQRFAFDDAHLRLRENLSRHTVEGSIDREFLQLIHGDGIHGAVPDDVGDKLTSRYVQSATIRQGHLSEFMGALQELSAFHEKNGMPAVRVWAARG